VFLFTVQSSHTERHLKKPLHLTTAIDENGSIITHVLQQTPIERRYSYIDSYIALDMLKTRMIKLFSCHAAPNFGCRVNNNLNIDSECVQHLDKFTYELIKICYWCAQKCWHDTLWLWEKQQSMIFMCTYKLHSFFFKVYSFYLWVPATLVTNTK